MIYIYIYILNGSACVSLMVNVVNLNKYKHLEIDITNKRMRGYLI
jgi:hypothetical protein